MFSKLQRSFQRLDGVVRGMTDPDRKPLHRWVFQAAAALVSALLLGLSFPLFDLFPFAWIAFIPLIVAVRDLRCRRGWLLAFAAGMVFWLIHASWMDTFHPLALVSAIPALAVYFAFPFVFAGMWKTLTADRWRWSWPIVFSLSWVAVEYFRSLGFLAFTWGTVGYSQYLYLPVIQIADTGGVWLVSFLVMFVNSALAQYLLDRQRSAAAQKAALRVLHGAWVLFFAANSYGAVKLLGSVEAPEYRVSLVQAFTDPVLDWRNEQQISQTLKKIEQLTSRAAADKPDLIVWSETLMAKKALYYYKYIYPAQPDSLAGRLGKWFIEFPARFSNTILMTAPHRELRTVVDPGGGAFRAMQNFNSAFLYSKNGKLLGVYHKMHLVPFGEWFPYKKQLPWVAAILEKTIASNFTPGKKLTVFHDGKARFSAVICYEDIFGDQCRLFVLRGAEFLINTTNDYWSRSLRAQVQHFAISVFRAVENRRYLVRAANTGVTAIVDEFGRIEQSLPNHTTGVLTGNIRLNKNAGKTLYTRLGDWFGQVVLFLTALLVLCRAGLSLVRLAGRLKTGFMRLNGKDAV